MFVFKVKKTRNSERAVYGTLEKTFVDSYRRGKAAKKLLDSLAAFDAEEAEEV